MKDYTINYQIDFFSPWHCGSGLAAGAETDALVIKDKNGLPFIPGRTVKGLVRQAVEEVSGLKGDGVDVVALFGDEGSSPSSLFFSNAVLTDAEVIVAEHLQSQLFSETAYTAIDKDGIAKQGSLRRMETVIPCQLQGRILGIPSEEDKAAIVESLAYIKNLGLHRNRGLGRCTFTVKED